MNHILLLKIGSAISDDVRNQMIQISSNVWAFILDTFAGSNYRVSESEFRIIYHNSIST